MKDTDLAFSWQELKSCDVVISHHGSHATTLRGNRAADFLRVMAGADPAAQQQKMASLTGNYKRGNERTAKLHSRNR